MNFISYSYTDKSTNFCIEQQYELNNPSSLSSLADEIEKLKVEINNNLTDRVKIEAEEKKKNQQKINDSQAHKTKKQKVDN
ncbi:hypothetical protein H8356DRAFT_1679036 [Neocallimastix lanati (nom. inval.)]|uniref:EKC/KEOPS complex subunit GON7 n=1 Tax=Neocallimastix californiae TaxID=1754190 RepID=A0A1Y2CTF5_9FUNG|nr:hypothetical protein H8356DRAFT_1679036 [Neocallimastix sp. JGI-2020a]ORY50124.1 hypothetical protein LY90DRAFT_293530 [Neocallimastix californiae]|eukprot:ORY50124.1 hypothetical protein LY90DRAFT_293530 [Neocallimastix californiae]